MSLIKRAILALALIAGITPAFAQAPPPVPTLPDTERRTSYSISGTTCACAVNFALYGDSTDYQNWIEVFINGTRVNFNDSTFGWTITSPTGSLATIPRPVTDAVLTFNSVQTGTIQIVGARRPRRLSTFSENRGVAARDLNQVLNDMIAQTREVWDKANDFTGRALQSQPGNTVGLLPLPTSCQGKFLGFDATGLIPLCTSGGAGSGNVVGPVTSTVGHVALWNNGTGTLLSDDGGGVPTNILKSQTANYAIATTDCGKTIQAGTGSTGFFTLTLPAVTGFPTTCVVTVKNGDSARGKLLSGFPIDLGGGFNILWPLQSAVVGIINGAWATISNPGTWRAPGSITLNVDHAAGSDTNNDCLGTGAGACATFYNAYLMMQTIVRPGSGGTTNILDSNAGETFTETPPGAFLGPTLTGGSGGGVLFLNLNGATWNTAGININDGAVLSLKGGTIQCTGSGNTAVSVPKGGLFVISSGMTFGGCTAGAHMQVFNGANIAADFGYTVSAIGNFHVIVNTGGNFSVAGKAISVPNALTFSSWISGNAAANANFVGTTFSGTGAGAGSTGKKYDFHSNATLFLSGATLPGATAGTIDTGACVDATGPCAIEPVTQGGTGLATLTAHGVMLGEGTSNPSFPALGSSGQMLTSNGGSTDPSFQSVPSLWAGNAQSLTQNTQNFCGTASCSGGGTSTSFPVQKSGTFRNLIIFSTTAPAAGQTYTATIYEGGLLAVTCTISNPSTSCSDTTHTATHTAGNAFFFRIDLSATAGNNSFAYGVELDTP